MFQHIPVAPPDPILGITEAFRADPNPDKINLSVGVYKDADGKTPVLECVKEAERRILAEETAKSYLGIDGLPEYGKHVRELLFGGDEATFRQVFFESGGRVRLQPLNLNCAPSTYSREDVLATWRLVGLVGKY